MKAIRLSKCLDAPFTVQTIGCPMMCTVVQAEGNTVRHIVIEQELAMRVLGEWKRGQHDDWPGCVTEFSDPPSRQGMPR